MEDDSKIIQDISALHRGDVAQFLQDAHALLNQRYDEEKDEQCIEGAHYLLNNYPVSPSFRIKMYSLICMANEDWHEAEDYRKRAESLYATLINQLAVGSKVNMDMVNMRNELNALAEYQLENQPATDKSATRPEPLPDRLVIPSLESIVAKGNTQKGIQRVQYLLEECEDIDEHFCDNNLAEYAIALQQIFDNHGARIPPLVALRLHILLSHATTRHSWAVSNRENAEKIWQEQTSKWDLQMPVDVDSFMQAARRELDSLSKTHQENEAAEAETALGGFITLPTRPK